MLYLIIERFRNGDAVPVYRRFRDQGRLAPADPALIAQWTERWSDLVDFEVIPVRTSAETQAEIGPRL